MSDSRWSRTPGGRNSAATAGEETQWNLGGGETVQPVEAGDGRFGFGTVGGLGRQGDPEPFFADGGSVSLLRDTHQMKVVSSFPTIMFPIIT